ncbi:MAG TPA: choice-of-anchor Q domain-containing protein, partial [Chthoniobacterales bacterium]
YNNVEGVMVITKCTFTQNSARGSAIANFGSLAINNSTVAGNTSLATTCGGVFDFSGQGGAVRIRNTIVAGNFGSGNNGDVQGDFISEGYNLIGNAAVASGFGAMGDQVGVSPAQVNLGLLQDNGGPTPTMVPGGVSLATDQGKRGLDENGQPINTDQRNSPSPIDLPAPNAVGGDGSDIGAVENGLPQPGPTFVVTSTAGHSFAGCTVDDCTLREALNASNANSDANVINFAPGIAGGIRAPTTDGFQITNPVTINGPGARTLRLAASIVAGRVLNITTSGSVAVSGLRINGAYLQSGNGAGVLVNSGNVTLTDCAISFNSVDGSQSSGGGVYNALGATVTLLRCAVESNSAKNQFGGGVYNEGTFVATNCTFYKNVALRGGAILSRASGGASRMTLRNCTVTNNSATDNVASPGFGGGGVFAEGGAAQYFVANNIIALNNSTNDPDVRGNYTSDGHNLIGKVGDSTGLTHGVKGDLVGSNAMGIDPQFNSFGYNGGPTQTMSLLASSPAFNAGDNALAPPTDQRGFARSGTSDIGAYEINGLPPPVQLVSVLSRKTHGSVGAFDLNLALAEPPVVESRSGGATRDHTLIFTFANTLSSVGSVAVTSGAGTVSSSAIGYDARQLIVNLTGVANAQRITVSVTNVTDSLGYNVSVTASMGVLLGDSNDDRSVNSGDAQQTRSRSGQGTNGTNFRSDCNLDGAVNSGDAFIVRARSGQGIP